MRNVLVLPTLEQQIIDSTLKLTRFLDDFDFSNTVKPKFIDPTKKKQDVIVSIQLSLI